MLLNQPGRKPKRQEVPFGGIRIRDGLFMGDHYAAKVFLKGLGVFTESHHHAHRQLQCSRTVMRLFKLGRALFRSRLAGIPDRGDIPAPRSILASHRGLYCSIRKDGRDSAYILLEWAKSGLLSGGLPAYEALPLVILQNAGVYGLKTTEP